MSSSDNLGNMIAMVCNDGLVIACLKQFSLEFNEVGELYNVKPKYDSEYDNLVEVGDFPKLVLGGLGWSFKLCPLMNMIAGKIAECKENFISRPSIKTLSKDVLKYANTFLGDEWFHLFIAGADLDDLDFFGKLKLKLRYVNNSATIEVPNMYVVGHEADLIRSQIGPFRHTNIDEAISLIKLGFATVARKEEDLQAGYISVRVIKLDGTVIEYKYDDLDLLVQAYFPTEAQSDEDEGDENNSNDMDDEDDE